MKYFSWAAEFVPVIGFRRDTAETLSPVVKSWKELEIQKKNYKSSTIKTNGLDGDAFDLYGFHCIIFQEFFFFCHFFFCWMKFFFGSFRFTFLFMELFDGFLNSNSITEILIWDSRKNGSSVRHLLFVCDLFQYHGQLASSIYFTSQTSRWN